MRSNKYAAIFTVFISLFLFILINPSDDPSMALKIATMSASVVFVFMFIYYRFLWRFPPFSYWHHTVDVGGKWHGKGTDANGNTKKIQLKITQYFTDVRVKLTVDDYVSESIFASLKKERNGLFLYFMYRGKPKQKVSSKDELFLGTMIIRCDPDVLNGEYFTSINEKSKIELYRI